MGKRIVGYAISLSGTKDGPWESRLGPPGNPVARLVRWVTERKRAHACCKQARYTTHPNARVFRPLRRGRHRAEEREVIRLAMAYFLTNDMSNGVEFSDVLMACAALRAKRGGK